jgi:hypothetical protein
VRHFYPVTASSWPLAPAYAANWASFSRKSRRSGSEWAPQSGFCRPCPPRDRVHLFASCGRRRRGELLALTFGRPRVRKSWAKSRRSKDGREDAGAVWRFRRARSRPVRSSHRAAGLKRRESAPAACSAGSIATGDLATIERGPRLSARAAVGGLEGNFAGHSLRGSFATGGRRGPADPKLRSCAAGAGRASGGGHNFPLGRATPQPTSDCNC